MNKKIKDLLLFVLTASLVAASATYFGKVLRPTETDINVININTFHDLPNNSVEVILFGSSRMWRGVDTMEMYDAYGIGAYNLGCNWQHINTTNLFVHDALKSQKPKLVVIDTTNAHLPLMDVNMDGEIYYTEEIPWSITKYKTVRQYFGRNLERYFSYFVPLCAFHENWQNVNSSNFAKENIRVDFLTDMEDVDVHEFEHTMGFGRTDEAVSVTLGDYQTFEQLKFEKYATDVLDDIVNTCHAAGVEVIFVTLPFDGSADNSLESTSENYIDAIKQYSLEHKCSYINIYEHIDEIGINPDTDFGDPSHLNTNGAIKVADYIGQYINDNYELTDYRTIENNQWENARR